MQVLIDTDGFCKLAACGLLEAAVDALGASLADVRRLPALPWMLKRGKLARDYGAQRCAAIGQVAATTAVAPEPAAEWLNRFLAPPSQFDPGEAQLFALAADDANVVMLSGDKRAIESIALVEGLAERLRGRVVTLEAALIAVCKKVGVERVRQSVAHIRDVDGALRACFSSHDPLDVLERYQANLSSKLPSGLLWAP